MENRINYENHSFSVKLATDIGLESAIIIQHLFYWCKANSDNLDMIKDGHIWVYISRKKINSIYPYLKEGKIRGAIDRLKKEGYIKIANYNKLKIDKTNWYALTDKGYALFDTSLDILTNGEIEYPTIGENNQAIQAINNNDIKKEYNKEDKKEYKEKKKILFFSPSDEEKEAFEKFRRKYPGQKRGLQTELDLLIKKHKDWKEIIPILSDAIDVENRKRKEAERAETFFPLPKNLQTYINNRSWEAYVDEINPNYDNEYHPSTNGSDVRWNEYTQYYQTYNPWSFDKFCDGYTNKSRPDGATVFCQGKKYVWSKEQEKWIHD